MKFDRFDESDTADLLLPEGSHECEIVKVKEVTRKADGRELVVIELRDVDGTYEKASKFLDPSEKRDHRSAMQLLAALGLPPDAAIDSSLDGRRVKVTTARGVSKRDGLPVVYVNAFAASSNPGEPAPPPAAKPARKAAAAKTLGDDDIPF
jgi:hypothetical protein